MIPLVAAGPAPVLPPRPRMAGPRRSPSVRHLAYHVYPRSGSSWPVRVLRLRESLDLFNGRRVIVVVTDETTDTADDVYDLLSGERFTHLELKNDPRKREGLTLAPLFECLDDLVGPEHATLWGHAKGVTRGNQPNIQRWTETQEELLLDYWDVVERLLSEHACCGAFKKLGCGWPASESLSDWHYSGAWFWFRNDQLFTRSDWKLIDSFWGAIESYPSMHWVSEDAASIFGLEEVPYMNLYKNDYWNTFVAKELYSFRQQNTAKESKLVDARINIGCGPFRAEGWWNTDFVSDDVVHPDQVVTPGRPLPFPDGTFTAAYAGHVLEHIWWDEVLPFLVDVRRVVKPGGTVCVVGPDAKKALQKLRRAKDWNGAWSHVWEILEDSYHHQADQPGKDRTGLTHLWNCYEERVATVMVAAGFRDVQIVAWNEDCLPHWPVVDYSNSDQFAVLGVVP
jgi:SAM-dependent methyltransferase